MGMPVGENVKATVRGPVEHKTRDQILHAADAHFRHYGYNKTTVADLAKAIGASPAYVYRFYRSKQEIGEAVCAMTLGVILSAAQLIVEQNRPATERMRRFYRTLVAQGFEIFFNERKLHEIVTAAVDGQWQSTQAYRRELDLLVRRLVVEGREAGEFERKTPLDDACQAISSTLIPFCHPILLEQNERADLEASAERVASLVLRSLAP